MTISCTESSTSVPNHMCMAQHRETTGNGWFPTKHCQILGERLVPIFEVVLTKWFQPVVQLKSILTPGAGAMVKKIAR